MELQLGDMGEDARVIEDCLNGRRTAWEDPYKPGRNGLVGLEQRIEINSPLSLVVVLLGTNDFQSMHQLDAWQSSQGMAAIISSIRRAPIEPEMMVPEILVVAPPSIRTATGAISRKFLNAEKKATGLADALQAVARDTNCHFFDAGSVTETSKVDGVHLDEDQHRLLGRELAIEVKQLLHRTNENSFSRKQ